MDDVDDPRVESLLDIERDSLAPFNIIRTETVLSKLPVHNLAKKGKVDIRIVRRTDAGDLQLKWEVSHSDRYGQPRQLAYKLDTLVVNRRLDEEQRPLPTVVRVGSLKDICKELGLCQSGKNTKDLRIAFMQNASAFINAHLTYRSTDGSERRLEAGFTRYGVVFTGEKLPDGRQADAVYVTLNKPYWDVVNTAPVRPLNYDYLKQLAPAAQRFYEVVSFRIFAALKNNRSQATLSYGEYCMFSAQQRYYEHENFRVQMYKIHKPHIDSGYLKSVSVRTTQDAEGNPDWVMLYTPGPKAHAEFITFNGKPAGGGLVPRLANTTEPQREDAGVDDSFLRLLLDRGITQIRAKKLLDAVTEDQNVTDQIEWVDSLIRTAKPGDVRNPAGFYVSIIRDNVRPPDTFRSSRQARLQEEETRRSQETLVQQQAIELRYDEYRRDEVTQHIKTMPEGEFQNLVAKKCHEYSRQYRSLSKETLDGLAVSGARAEIEGKLHLMTFGQFTQTGNPGHKGRNEQQELFPLLLNDN